MSPEIILGQYKFGTGNIFIFMLAAFSGIWLTMILARIILLSDLPTKFFAYVGRESFHIMALHFVGFKLLTSFYVISEGADYHLMNYYIINEIPPFLYIVFGIGIPLLFRKIYDESKRRFL